MNKKKEIESLLDMRITDWMFKELGIYWKAFYEEPFKYRGTIVVPMVKQYINQRMDEVGEVIK